MTGKQLVCAIAFIPLGHFTFAQKKNIGDSVSKWSVHFQTTIISQFHSAFRSLYSGANSLADSTEPLATSFTATVFIGRRLWKGATLYVNPELSAGKGLSFANGVAGALNGETYRVGGVKPQLSLVRAYLQQQISLNNSPSKTVEGSINQLADNLPESRLTITAGKFAISDFYDGNNYSKDPRTQFFNWSLWANGAWDYPADTKGYTTGIVVELIKPEWAFRISSVAVPRIANYHTMEFKLPGANAETIEYEHKLNICKKSGVLRLLLSENLSKAPSYRDGINALSNGDQFIPAVIQGKTEGRSYGGKKFGIGLNLEQELTPVVGVFTRIGWNDGHYASWAFTEIDHTVSAGILMKGIKWKRPGDRFGVAAAINGLSEDHKEFLKNGGYGFIIGDGRLNYRNEYIVESFYNSCITSYFWLTVDYQFIGNPAYNKDRGPVHVFGIRLHLGI